jgi:nucleotide-binding universal stress UspA family protein
MYKNILIATDGSDFAKVAIEHGMHLAKAMDSFVTIITVTENWSALEMAQMAKVGAINPIEDYEKTVADAAKKILTSAEEITKGLGLTCETLHVKDKHPADGIIETANSRGADLIVMASHGRRGIEKILLGSIASEVLTKSKLPVLIVKQK